MDPQYEGAQYGQQEFRHGEKTQGEYHVRLPDGRYQSVNYQVDGAAASGFIADVSYDEGIYLRTEVRGDFNIHGTKYF